VTSDTLAAAEGLVPARRRTELRQLAAKNSRPHGPDRRILVMMKPARAASRRYLPASPFNRQVVDPPVEQFAVHDLVNHDQYGLGVVIGVEDEIAVLVDFRPRRERITAPYHKMTKL
jgi:hypothetical protein